MCCIKHGDWLTCAALEAPTLQRWDVRVSASPCCFSSSLTSLFTAAQQFCFLHFFIRALSSYCEKRRQRLMEFAGTRLKLAVVAGGSVGVGGAAGGGGVGGVGVLNAAIRRYGPIRKIRRGKHVASISPFVRKHFAPLGSTCIQSDHRSPCASAWPAAAAEYSGTDRYPTHPPPPLHLHLLPPICVRCHISGAEVSLMIGGCSQASHRCTKQHFHDKLAPLLLLLLQLCSLSTRSAFTYRWKWLVWSWRLPRRRT